MQAACPFCRSPIEAEALKCPHCQSVVGEYKVCPDCRESVSAEARVCRYCGHRWAEPPGGAPDAERQDEDILRQVWADNLGAMITEPSITALFFPPVLTITPNEARIRKWSLLGLRAYRQRISTQRIASVRFLKGVFWGGIVIETFGGASGDLVITGLRKSEAQEAAALLEKLAGKSES